MSPLVRSLLALATILAVATAFCSEMKKGSDGIFDIPLTTVSSNCPSDSVPANPYCEDQGYRTCGVTITACNPNSNGEAPTIDVPQGLTPVYVQCNDPYALTSNVTIIEHCCSL